MPALTARCIAEIDGTRYDSRAEASPLVSVSVDYEADVTGEASVTFADPDFKIIDRHLDSTGMRYAELRLWLYYGRDPGAACFGGKLVGVESDSLRSTLRFHDRSRELKQTKKSRYHNDKTDAQIMSDIAAEYGLSFQLVGEGVDSEPHASLIQRGLTDWGFIKSLARRAGWRIWVDGGVLYAQETGVKGQSGVTLQYREDFLFMRPLRLSYKLPENRRGRYKHVKVHTRGAGGERLTGEDSEDERGRVDSGGRHGDLPHHTLASAARRARAARLKSKERAFDCQITLLPVAGRVISLRSVVTLAGVGAFFGGNYVVHAIRRRWSKGSLLDELTLKRDIGKAKAKQKRRARGIK